MRGGSYLAWLSQTVPILKIHDMMVKDVLNSNYSIWCRKDQFLLSWINSSLVAPIFSTMFGLHTSQQVWSALAQSFANQSRPRVSHLKKQLQNFHQGSKPCAEYLQFAKSWANHLAAIGKPIDDEDLISFIMGGVNPSFNPFITSFFIATRDKALSLADFQDELLNHEMLLNQ